jgi:hypothetical protein
MEPPAQPRGASPLTEPVSPSRFCGNAPLSRHEKHHPSSLLGANDGDFPPRGAHRTTWTSCANRTTAVSVHNRRLARTIAITFNPSEPNWDRSPLPPSFGGDQWSLWVGSALAAVITREIFCHFATISAPVQESCDGHGGGGKSPVFAAAASSWPPWPPRQSRTPGPPPSKPNTAAGIPMRPRQF